ncbi:EpsG family protein [Vibrio sp. MA40-2]|uniref:EpsG family protein n=1 Tax=Vibrio sp. MA40-2 TaxID=3391828 RepID=UPI0039A4D8F9
MFISLNRFIFNLLLLGIGLYLTFVVPVDAVLDRHNYLTYAKGSIEILQRNFDISIFYVFFNDPLWLLLNTFLMQFLSPESVIRSLIFFPFVLTGYISSKKVRNKELILYLFLVVIFPLVIKNNIVHLRQGVAICFFCIGWFFFENAKARVLFYLLATLIHSSFWFLAPFGIWHYFHKKLGYKRILYWFGTISLILCIIFIFKTVVSYLPVRQVERVVSSSLNVSGIGLFFWSSLLLLFFTFKKNELYKYRLIISILPLYISGYFFVPFISRVFESFVIFIIIIPFLIDGKNRFLAFLPILVFIFYYYFTNLGKPFFGWGY